MTCAHPENNMNLNEKILQVGQYYGGDHRRRACRTRVLFYKEDKGKHLNLTSGSYFTNSSERKSQQKAIVAALAEMGQQKETI